jgi:hypothetical protein
MRREYVLNLEEQDEIDSNWKVFRNTNKTKQNVVVEALCIVFMYLCVCVTNHHFREKLPIWWYI